MGFVMDETLYCQFGRDVLITSETHHLSEESDSTLALKVLKGSAQKWQLQHAGGHKVFIRSNQGKYLSNSGGTPVLTDAKGLPEQWTLATAGVGQVTISG